MSPNILFILYLVVAIPLFIVSKYHSVAATAPLEELIPLWIGSFIGISFIPAVLLVIYNIKKTNKYIKTANCVVIIIWILLFVFSTLQTLKDFQN